MNLALDQGNTRMKWGIFHGDELIDSGRNRDFTISDLRHLIKENSIRNCILSAVAPVDFADEIPSLVPHFVRLDHHTKVPIEIQYRTKETLGMDRVAAVTGAHAEWPDRHVLVIDAGTCLKIEFLNDKGQWLGGNISPGPELRFRSMNDWTHQLPLVGRPAQPQLIGRSTEEALQTGGFMGCVAEIEGWIGLAAEHLDDAIVVLSGGDAERFASFIKKKNFVRPNLVLTGLNEILKLYVGEE